jgi:hypothetical protein
MAAHPKAPTPELGDRLKGLYAVWASTARDHLMVRWQVGKASLKIGQRDVHGAGQIPESECVCWKSCASADQVG